MFRAEKQIVFAAVVAVIFCGCAGGGFGGSNSKTAVPGMVNRWSGDGNARDSVGGSSGVANKGVNYVRGKFGRAFHFNGRDGVVKFDAKAGSFGTNDFTIDYWMKTASHIEREAVLGNRAVCNHANFWEIKLGSIHPFLPPGQLGLALDGGAKGEGYVSFKAVGEINDGKWHNIAWERNGTTLLLYVDGILNTTTNSEPIADVTGNYPLTMGASVCAKVDDTAPYSGALDELELFNRALSPEEIKKLSESHN